MMRLSVIYSCMLENNSRRNFLQLAPLAAAALTLTERSALAADAMPSATPVPFALFTEAKIEDAMQMYRSQLGEHYLFQPKQLPLTIAMTTQEKVVGKMFEYHEWRDHIFLILDGATRFELGGTPKQPRNVRPGEWLAADSDGATTVEVKKGDMLVVPRGTPHRQSTDVSVAWVLISPSGASSV
jgi:mannose-6-phosphate isomerase-like protein (cupin superfamily)